MADVILIRVLCNFYVTIQRACFSILQTYIFYTCIKQTYPPIDIVEQNGDEYIISHK